MLIVFVQKMLIIVHGGTVSDIFLGEKAELCTNSEMICRIKTILKGKFFIDCLFHELHGLDYIPRRPTVVQSVTGVGIRKAVVSRYLKKVTGLSKNLTSEFEKL